jgi:hypothetical protein
MGNWERSILAEDLKELINCVIVYKTFVSENRKNIDYKGDEDRKHTHYIAGSRDKINLQIFCNEREW